MDRITVCVTGAGGPAGFNCIRSLAESDIEARIVALDMDRSASGLYHGADSSYVVPPARSEEFLLALTKILEREKVDVLLPTVDEEIGVICRDPILQRLSETVRTLLPSEEAAARALDKYLTVFEARRSGLPVPVTHVVPDPGEAEMRAEEMGMPLVVKPSRSRGARGISYVEVADQVEGAFRLASAEGGSVLLQEHIPGPVFTVGCVADDGGGIAASIVLRKTKEVPQTGGVAVAGVTVVDPELQELGERYVTSLGWRGPASVELKLDDRDGSYKLMEVNPRLFGYNYLASVAGVNLPEVTVRLAMGQSVEPRRSYREGIGFVRAPYDIIVEEMIRE